MGDIYFDGDPAVDSSRRHMERVLKGEPPRRKWPFVLVALAGGGLWALWRVAVQSAAARDAKAADETAERKSPPHP